MTSLWDKFADTLFRSQRYGGERFCELEVDPQNDDYAMQLLHTRGQSEKIVDREINRVLFRVRVVEPWSNWFLARLLWTRSMWGYAYGRYRKAREKIHGGTAQQSGGGSGTFVAPPGTAAPTAFVSAGAAAGQGTGLAPLPSGFTLTNLGAGYSTSALTQNAFEDAGVIAGEVTAYRCWQLKDDGLLYSVVMDSFCWEPRQTAEGNPNEGGGVHAFKDLLSAVKYGWEPTTSFRRGVCVLGTVDLWGDVFEHERGYRASRARIAAIFDSPSYDAAELRKKYGLNRRKKARKP